MKTKREVLEHIINYSCCAGMQCKECPYNNNGCIDFTHKITRIGAMAILRMFRQKKKPLLEVGTKIRFDNGKLYNIEKKS